MDIHRFHALLEDPARNQTDLITMRQNALHINAVEHVHAAECALDARFPNWRNPRGRRGGSHPTRVEYLGRKEYCESEKEAYIWLIERFVQHYPKPFVELDWETVFVAKGPRAMYFARSLRRLFGEKHQHLAADHNKYCQLSNGWFAKLVLSESQKLGLLRKFAELAGLRFGTDWDWNSLGKNPLYNDTDEIFRGLEGP